MFQIQKNYLRLHLHCVVSRNKGECITASFTLSTLLESGDVNLQSNNFQFLYKIIIKHMQKNMQLLPKYIE